MTSSVFDPKLWEYDVGLREYVPGQLLPSKYSPEGMFTWTDRAIEAATRMEMHPTDVISATYPKVGQTWTLAILGLIVKSKDLEAGIDCKVSSNMFNMPFIETEMRDGPTGAEMAKELPDPRVLKCHLPFELFKDQVKRHPNMKVVQTIRNPKDTLVSVYHHLRSEPQLGKFNGTWDQFFELFKEKKLPFGDYFHTNIDWYKFNKGRENSLIVKYEDMQKDHRGHVLKLAKFIGVELSDKIIDIIVQKTKKKDMAKDVNSVFEPLIGWDSSRSSFVRKGVVGDWVNYFSEEQSDYVDAKSKELLDPLGLTFDYSG